MRSTLGLYRPGNSFLHRMKPGVKLIFLLLLGASTIWIQQSWIAAVSVFAAICLLYFAAGFDPKTLWSQIRPMVFILGFMFVFHVWVSGWERAVSMTVSLLAIVAAAALITLTTMTTQLVDSIVRALGPLERVGVNPEKVGLMLTLGIRAVPLIVGLAQQVREAQIARNQTSYLAFAVPLIVSALRHADGMAEAIQARGIED